MMKVTPDNTEMPIAAEAEMPVMEAETKNGAKNGAENKSIKTPENEETVEAPGTRVGKKKGKEYKVLPGGPVYDAILKKKITKKEDIGGIAEDVLVEVSEHVYPIDFMILDIKENEKRPFILGTPFLTTDKALIKFDKGTITLRSGKSKVSFHRIPDSSCATDKGVKNDIEPIAPTMTVNRLVLEWEEKIKLHLEREMKFNQWRSKNFKGNRPTLVATKEGIDDEGEVT
ncbi:zinc finger, CCHC-type containing protein [Tanacetum coccineum]